MFGQYGNFMNEPTAHLASQFSQTALRHGQEYLEQNVRCPVSRCSWSESSCDAGDERVV